MIRKDLRTFYVFEHGVETDSLGGRIAEYTPTGRTIKGNLQPLREVLTAQAYGIDLKKAFELITADAGDAKELDGLGLAPDKPDYKIQTVKRWNTYSVLLLEALS